jgi:hypothetical protein
MAARVAEGEEPWIVTFDPAALVREVAAHGFSRVDDISPAALNARYFAGRTDGLRVRGLAHLIHADV